MPLPNVKFDVRVDRHGQDASSSKDYPVGGADGAEDKDPIASLINEYANHRISTSRTDHNNNDNYAPPAAAGSIWSSSISSSSSYSSSLPSRATDTKSVLDSTGTFIPGRTYWPRSRNITATAAAAASISAKNPFTATAESVYDDNDDGASASYRSTYRAASPPRHTRTRSRTQGTGRRRAAGTGSAAGPAGGGGGGGAASDDNNETVRIFLDRDLAQARAQAQAQARAQAQNQAQAQDQAASRRQAAGRRQTRQSVDTNWGDFYRGA
jgi:hypothetical protein